MVWLKKPADATVPLILIYYLQNIFHAMLYKVFNRTCCAPCVLYFCHSLIFIAHCSCYCHIYYTVYLIKLLVPIPRSVLNIKRRFSRLYLSCLRMLVPNLGGIVQSFSLTSQDRLLTYQVPLFFYPKMGHP
jgi:hypothetical protein